ncbi:hypothetical protein TNCV_324241 [Trichonephila clavipes]|nr:hypothetical protein TNCV_324241 [Trichonephila clavipes]
MFVVLFSSLSCDSTSLWKYSSHMHPAPQHVESYPRIPLTPTDLFPADQQDVTECYKVPVLVPEQREGEWMARGLAVNKLRAYVGFRFTSSPMLPARHIEYLNYPRSSSRS